MKLLNIYDDASFKSKAKGYHRSDAQLFVLEFDGLGTREEVLRIIRNDKRLPKMYDAYPQNRGQLMYVMDTDLQQLRDLPNVWQYNVTWETVENPQEAIKDPSKRPVLIATGTYKQQEYPYFDYDGRPLANTAGEAILYAQQKSYPTYTFTKNYESYPGQFAILRDMVNIDTVRIYNIDFEPYTLFCPEVHISPLSYEGQYQYFQFSATMYANGLKNRKGQTVGWKLQLRNQGYHEKQVTYEKLPNGQDNKKKPKVALKAIKIGTAGAPAYPQSPILLTPGGRAFREKKDGDPNDIEKYSGNIIGVHIPGEEVEATGITPEQFDAAIIEPRLVEYIKFNDYFPFK